MAAWGEFPVPGGVQTRVRDTPPGCISFVPTLPSQAPVLLGEGPLGLETRRGAPCPTPTAQMGN